MGTRVASPRLASHILQLASWASHLLTPKASDGTAERTSSRTRSGTKRAVTAHAAPGASAADAATVHVRVTVVSGLTPVKNPTCIVATVASAPSVAIAAGSRALVATDMMMLAG
mmetsp:Transcript_10727/g.29850  ORF Transcript_10727/g.29850 Transcript_10727/m.29850 type:complete len:114 (+) Transcript_10727:1855-2196(+)